MRPRRAYVICTLPRSGSTMLCEMLKATGIAGAPASLFHRSSLEAWLDDYDLDRMGFASERAAVDAVFAAATAAGMGGTDVFGLRLQGHSLVHFLARLAQHVPQAGSDGARLEAAFGPTTYIHLTRSDRVAQAISRIRAEQTGLWHRRADGSDLERLVPERPDDGYDSAAIARHISDLERLDAVWAAWFRQEGITPLRLTYEDLCADPRAPVRTLLTAIGCDPDGANGLAPLTAKLADEVSAAWRARYVSERPARHMTEAPD